MSQTPALHVDGGQNIVRINRIGCTRTRLTVAITMPDGEVSRASGYTLSFFRKQPDGRWLLARDANLLTAET